MGRDNGEMVHAFHQLEPSRKHQPQDSLLARSRRPFRYLMRSRHRRFIDTIVEEQQWHWREDPVSVEGRRSVALHPVREPQRFDLCALLAALQLGAPPAMQRRLLLFPYDLYPRWQAIFGDVDARNAHLAAKPTDAIELLTDAREDERAGPD